MSCHEYNVEIRSHEYCTLYNTYGYAFCFILITLSSMGLCILNPKDSQSINMMLLYAPAPERLKTP